MKKLFTLFTSVLIIILVLSTESFSADRYAVASGTWDATSTWSATRGGASGATVPSSSDTVYIPSPYTVTLTASGKNCYNLIIESGGVLISDNANPTSTQRYVRVSGDYVQNDGIIGYDPATPSVLTSICFESYVAGKTVTFKGNGISKISRIRNGNNVSNTTVVIDQDMTFTYAGSSGTGGAAWYGNQGTGVNNTFKVSAGRTVTCLSYAYICTSSSIDTDGPTTTIQVDGSLILQGIGGSMSLRPAAGATVTLTVNGTVEIGRTFKPTGTTGVNSTIIVNNGGLFKAGISGEGIIYFHSPTQTVTGLGTFQFLGGTMHIGATAGLDPVSGPIRTTTRSFTTDAAYEYIGTSVQVTGSDLPTTIRTLRTNNATGVTLSQNTRIDTMLSLTVGSLTLGSNNLTLGPSATNGGSPSVSAMVIAEGSGQLIKEFSGLGSFTYHVGDNTGTAEYSPVTLNFTSGSFSSAYAGVRLVNAKHPNNTSTTDFINRYWVVNSSGISGFLCDASFNYVDADINGTEANLYCGSYNGASWTPLNAVDAGANILSGTVATFSEFTGGESGAVPIELSNFNSFVDGNSVKLNWNTITEGNSYSFQVQRKTDKTDWAKIGEVIAAGNSNSPKDYSFTDRKLTSGKYLYRLKMIDSDGSYQYSNIVDAEISMPKEFSLLQNYPNPFNPSTTIDYSLPADSRVTLELYSLIGEKVADLVNKEQTSGFYSYYFNTSNLNLTSGVYLYKLTAVSKSNDVFSQSMKMLLLK